MNVSTRQTFKPQQGSSYIRQQTPNLILNNIALLKIMNLKIIFPNLTIALILLIIQKSVPRIPVS